MASFCPPRLPSPSPLKRIRVCARKGWGGEENSVEVLNAPRDLAGRFPRPAAKCRREKLHRDNYRGIGARYRHPRPPSLLLLEQENRSALVTSRFYLGNERCVVSSRSILILRHENIVESFLILISLSLFSHIMDPESKRIRHMCKGCCP